MVTVLLTRCYLLELYFFRSSEAGPSETDGRSLYKADVVVSRQCSAGDVLRQTMPMPASPCPASDSPLRVPTLPSSESSPSHLPEPASGFVFQDSSRTSLRLAMTHTLYSCQLLCKEQSLHIPCKTDRTAHCILRNKSNKYRIGKSRNSLRKTISMHGKAGSWLHHSPKSFHGFLIIFNKIEYRLGPHALQNRLHPPLCALLHFSLPA